MVRRLSIGLNLLALNPHDHPEVRSGVRLALANFEPYFNAHEEFLLGIGSRGWIVEGVDLSRENTRFGASARELHLRGISSIVFHASLREDILLAFLKIATLPVEQIESRGGLVRIAAEIPLTGINLFELDYSRMLAPSNLESHRALLENSKKSQELIENFGKGQTNADAARDESKPVEELAVLLNLIYKSREIKDIELAVDFTLKLAHHCLGKKGKRPPDTRAMLQLLSQLPPELIRRISKKLSGEKTKDGDTAKKNLDSFQTRLLSLFNSFQSPSAIDLDRLADGEDLWELQKLFDHPEQAAFSESESYRKFIRQAVQNARQESRCPQVSELSGMFQNKRREVLRELEPDSIKRMTLRAILELMELEANDDDFTALAAKLPDCFGLVALTLDYELIFDTLETLERHASSRLSDTAREAARQCIDELFSGDIVLHLLKDWVRAETPEVRKLENLFPRLNHSMVSTQLRLILSRTEDPHEKQRCLALLSRLSDTDPASLEADLKSPSTKTVLEALSILKVTPGDRSARLLESMLSHGDDTVKNAALDALMEQSSQKGLEILLERMPDFSPEQYDRAVNAIAARGKKEVVGKLKEFLAASDIFARTYDRRMRIIHALGRHRNQNAIPLLRELFSHSPFFRKAKNNSYRMAVLNALAKIGSREALYAVALLTQNEKTIFRLTGDALLENKEET
jgi:hypothetical protein